jgi:signal peptidase
MMVRILRGVAGIILVTFGAVVLAVLLLPRLFGSTAYVVTSGSMLPTFAPGSVIVTTPVNTDQLSNGDIVTFVDSSGGLTTHRVEAVTVSYKDGQSSTTITTKGDANEESDPVPLDPHNVVGKAEFAMPHLGYLVEWIKTPLGAGVLAALFLFVVFTGRTVKDDEAQEPVHLGEAVPVP